MYKALICELIINIGEEEKSRSRIDWAERLKRWNLL